MPEITTEPKRFTFQGKKNSYFELQLANWVLTAITFGIYYPWAKANTLRYLYQKTEFAGSRFTFHGTGKEMLKGYLKALAIFFLLFAVLLIGVLSGSNSTLFGCLVIFYLSIIGIMPMAIHGSMRYRASRSSWRGIYFGYRGKLKRLYPLFLRNLFYTIVTFGFYGAWFTVNLRREIIGNLRLGSARFSYEGEGPVLFKILLKGYFFTIITGGIYLFAFSRDLHNYYVNNIYVEHNGVYARMNSSVSGWELFKLVAVNMLIVVFSLGIASPVATVRTMRYLAANSTLMGIFNTNNLDQTEEEYKDATYEDITDLMDLNMV